MKCVRGIALFMAVTVFSGCGLAYKGGVNSKTYNYALLSQHEDRKVVDYVCNYEKIAAQDFSRFGDYCPKAPNQDYVSYFIPPDVQSTVGFRVFTAQSVANIANGQNSGRLVYFNIYSESGNAEDFSFKLTPPTSFAMEFKDYRYIAITKRDLLARQTVYPELTVRSFAVDTGKAGTLLSDYSVTYQIGSYIFKVPYTDNQTGRYLGLPTFEEYQGSLSGQRKISLEAYSVAISSFWENPMGHRYSADYLTGMDYAIPAVGRSKVKRGVNTDAGVKIAPPAENEGLLSDYLPSYKLKEINIVYTGADGAESVVHTYSEDEIYSLLINPDADAALVYRALVIPDELSLNFVYEANEPLLTGLTRTQLDTLGLGYIYSDIAYTLVVNLAIENYYKLENFPVACLTEDTFPVLKKVGMQPNPLSGKCTPVVQSINRQLPVLFNN